MPLLVGSVADEVLAFGSDSGSMSLIGSADFMLRKPRSMLVQVVVTLFVFVEELIGP